MDLQRQAALMQAASQYADEGVAYLGKKLGHQPSDQETLVFTSAVASMLASWAYCRIYEASDAQHADAWMQQIFMQLAMGVKGRGTPVTLQITSKSIPDKSSKLESGVAAETPPVDICKCVTDMKGNCQLCSSQLVDDLSRIVDFTAELERFQGRERCRPCVQRHFDQSFSQVVLNRFGSIGPEMRDMITAMTVQMGAAHGVSGIPETEKALASIAAEEERSSDGQP